MASEFWHDWKATRVWRRLALYLLLGVGFAALSDYLPVGEAAKRGLTRVWGPFWTSGYPASGRDQVTVVLLDDDDLKSYDEPWPASLGFHQRRLQEMAKYQPKAIFLDMVFLDDRRDPGLQAFIAAACQIRAAGVPLALGSFRQVGRESSIQQQMLAAKVEVDGQSVPCIEEAYLHAKIDQFDQSAWDYELNLGTESAPRYSPATWLYSQGHAVTKELLTMDMALIWGTTTHPVNLDWINQGKLPDEACGAEWSGWDHLKVWGAPPEPLCPYHLTLPMRTLKRTYGFSNAQLEQAIHGKYLIYGTNLQSSGDVIASPYHGRQAGAYLHAMALDNLLSFDGKPKYAGDFAKGKAATLFILFGILLVSVAVAFHSEYLLIKEEKARAQSAAQPDGTHPRLSCRLCHALCKRAPGLARALVWWSVVGLMMYLLFQISYHGLELGPLVWIEFVLFPIALEFLEWGERMSEALEGWVDDLSVRRP